MYKNPTLTLLVDTVAVYRLTKLATEDRITEDLRELLFKHFPPQSTRLGYLMTCGWCVSIWAAGVIFTLRKISPATADYVSSILAASAVTGIAYSKGL
jgi:Protein of unknown function (DUF1360)